MIKRSDRWEGLDITFSHTLHNLFYVFLLHFLLDFLLLKGYIITMKTINQIKKGANEMEEQTISITEKQSELWNVAEVELKKIGGLSGITRNPDAEIRAAAKKEGAREWALLETSRLSAGCNDEIMNDEFCQSLIDIIRND